MRANSFLAAALIPGSLGVAALLSPASYVIPSGQVNGTTDADSIVGLKAFDGPHIAVNNGSAYQWWYFDAVSKDSDASVVAQFYPGWFPESSAILLNLVFPNGSVIQEIIPVGNLELTTVGDGSQGRVENGVMSWIGAPDLSFYFITLDVLGVSGTIALQSRTPSHVACGLNSPGSSFNFAPFLNWGNSVPDSHATVDLVVNGTRLSFTGSGYHDQNWGSANFVNALNHWYWGHASVGEYSLVFFYHFDLSLKVTSSVYLSKNGKPIITNCADGTINVTPQGHGTSTPTEAGDDVVGWKIEIKDSVHGEFLFNIENTVLSGGPVYSRWVGRTTGGRVGETKSTGPAIVEWMTNPALVPKAAE